MRVSIEEKIKITAEIREVIYKFTRDHPDTGVTALSHSDGVTLCLWTLDQPNNVQHYRCWFNYMTDVYDLLDNLLLDIQEDKDYDTIFSEK